MTSQSERIYTNLRIFGSITNAQAHNDYGIRHLPAVIRDIKKKYSVEIATRWESGINRFNEKCRWEVYTLNEQKSA